MTRSFPAFRPPGSRRRTPFRLRGTLSRSSGPDYPSLFRCLRREKRSHYNHLRKSVRLIRPSSFRGGGFCRVWAPDVSRPGARNLSLNHPRGIMGGVSGVPGFAEQATFPTRVGGLRRIRRLPPCMGKEAVLSEQEAGGWGDSSTRRGGAGAGGPRAPCVSSGCVASWAEVPRAQNQNPGHRPRRGPFSCPAADATRRRSSSPSPPRERPDGPSAPSSCAGRAEPGRRRPTVLPLPGPASMRSGAFAFPDLEGLPEVSGLPRFPARVRSPAQPLVLRGCQSPARLWTQQPLPALGAARAADLGQGPPQPHLPTTNSLPRT